MSIAALAKDLASKGRFGDNALLHVSTQELAGLAALMPNGKLSINPETGLPEAFFFLPFLGALGGLGAAGAAGAGLGATAAGLGAAAAPAAAAGGLGALTAAAPAAATGLGASAIPAVATSALPAATTAALPTAGALGAAAPATSALGAGITEGMAAASGIGGLGSAAPTAAAAPLAEASTALTAAAPDALSVTTTPITATAPTAPTAPTSALGPSINPANAYGGAPISPVDVPGSGAGAWSNAPAASPNVTVTPEAASPLSATTSGEGIAGLGADATTTVTPETTGGIFDSLSGFDPMALAPLAMMMPTGGGGGGGGEDDEEAPELAGEFTGGDPSFPGSDYRPGTDPEWEYFSSGGKVKGYMGGGMISRTGQDMQNRYACGGKVKKYAAGGQIMSAPMQPQLPMTPGQPMGDPAMGGGIAQLMQPNAMQATNMPEVPSSQAGSPYVGNNDPQAGMDQNVQDQQLIQETVAAIQGQHPNPDAIILAFVNTFGEQALQDLVSRVGGGQSSDGMSDSVPAMINGKEPAALSEGEYVIPADVVSGLGNGSTDAGARQLDELSGRVRAFRQGGMVEQPPRMDPKKVMPA